MSSDFLPLADVQSLLWQHVTNKKERDLLEEYAGPYWCGWARSGYCSSHVPSVFS